MGLRADKQRRQRGVIIENTVALSRELGPDAVRTRDIAARSGISEATFFNYFAGKDHVLREWADDLVDNAFAAGVAAHTDGAGLRRCVRALADDLGRLGASNGALLARGLAAARPGDGGSPQPPGRGREARPCPVLRLVEAGRARDEIRGDAPPEQLAEMLRSVVSAALLSGLDQGPGEAGPMARRIRVAADVLLDGLRKRNERVRAPARGAAAASRVSAPTGS